MKRRSPWLRAILPMLLALLLASPLAWGRAGGGGSYSGGSHSSGSHSSGSHDSGSPYSGSHDSSSYSSGYNNGYQHNYHDSHVQPLTRRQWAIVFCVVLALLIG